MKPEITHCVPSYFHFLEALLEDAGWAARWLIKVTKLKKKKSHFKNKQKGEHAMRFHETMQMFRKYQRKIIESGKFQTDL